MNNFSDFITKDIDAKKTLISTLPTKTKTNKKKYNEEIESIIKKYDDYKKTVKKYLLAKSKSFGVKETPKEIEALKEKLAKYEYVKFLLNPSNTSYEKMGLDDLIYKLRNSSLFNFNALNDVINNLLNKFELAGISINSESFNYTCYVHEYMSSFLEVRYKNDGNYKHVSEVFERIYWVNPELIQHIELNFRRLIRDNVKKFDSYVSKITKEAMSDSGISNYQEANSKLLDAYSELEEASKENVYDIVELAKSGTFDINQYLENNKVRINAYQSIIDSSVDYSDLEKMNKTCKIIEMLKSSVMEYENYINFGPLFDNFKEEFQPLLTIDQKGYKGLKTIEDEIISKEKELDKLNRKIFSDKKGLFESSDNDKLLKVKAVNIAKEVYSLYEKYDVEYFNVQVLKILNSTMSILDVVNLYHSFPYFKKLDIQKAFKLESYEEIMQYSDTFDVFASNPTNVIINGIQLFEETDVIRNIVNKYRLHNLRITENDLESENIRPLINKLLLILRVNTIENSSTTLDKIWFMVSVEKIRKIEDQED